VDGGYDPCDNSTFFESKRKKRDATATAMASATATAKLVCDDGYFPDSINEYCYKSLDNLGTLDEARSNCTAIGAQLIKFETDIQASGFLRLLKTGSNKIEYLIQTLTSYHVLKIFLSFPYPDIFEIDIHWKSIKVITLRQREADNIKQMIAKIPSSTSHIKYLVGIYLGLGQSESP
jgi:hypothetical protein